jgi:predicted Rdx family selenoprotein
VEAEIRSVFSNAEVTLTECGFGIFKVFLNGETIFRKWPIFGSFPREGEIIEKIRDKMDSQ